MSSAGTLDLSAPRAFPARPVSLPPSIVLFAVLVATAVLMQSYSWRQGLLFLVGVFAGVVLYHTAFGFTTAWRRVIAGGSGEALRAQMLMLALTSVVFVPLLARGEIFGRAVSGAVAPVGGALLVGAFMFGVGMQLGGGCASGTLYSSGGGSARMLVTLAAFVAGSVIGAHDMPFWGRVPAFAPISLVDRFGVLVALGVSLALFAGVSALSLAIERWRAAVPAPGASPPMQTRLGRGAPVRVFRGPWPLVAGAVGLAAVNIATLLLAGRPWGVTSAFALWGSKALAMGGVDVAAWPYWQTPARAADLQASMFHDITSIMNIGIMLGASMASMLAGRFAPTWRIPGRSLVAAVVGGLLLGYGARIAYGCNIGAFFGGIASSSLHGWVWFMSAFAGNMIGTSLRPWFGLDVEAT